LRRLERDHGDVVQLRVGLFKLVRSLNSLVPLPPSLPTPRNLRNRRVTARLNTIVYRLIRERRASGEDRGDVLSMLLAAARSRWRA
jgi:cytochrome P450